MSKADNTQPLTVMGLMSGTSVDAVDACLARLEFINGRLQHEILATHSLDLPEALRTRLLRCMAEKTVHLEELCALNVAVGELFAETALGLIRTHGINPKSIDCIGSHGQTLYHWPPPVASDNQPGRLGGTLQIGEPSIIAEKTGIYTIADFRPRDMAAGGQGAPLVCFADLLLFQDEHRDRCIQNIGGIANVTVVPSRQAAHAGKPVIAFDTGPGNMLMDAAMAHFYGKPYDENGAVAASGTVNEALLANLMAHPYLRQAPPKTTGRELFGLPCLQELLAGFSDISSADWLATLTRFTAESIVDAYSRFVFPGYDVSEMVVGGGGAYNAFLMETLRTLFAQRGREIAVKTHADYGIHDKYKEALAFAILAWASLLHRPNNIPACTGASHPVVLGKHIPA
jgi:anhydro-N-acetylmuramic acid kinase